MIKVSVVFMVTHIVFGVKKVFRCKMKIPNSKTHHVAINDTPT